MPCFSSLLSLVQQGTFSSMCMITTLLQGSKPHMLMPCLLWRENNNGTWWTLDSSFALQFRKEQQVDQGRVESDLVAKELDLERGSVGAQDVVGLVISVSIVITQ